MTNIKYIRNSFSIMIVNIDTDILNMMMIMNDNDNVVVAFLVVVVSKHVVLYNLEDLPLYRIRE